MSQYSPFRQFLMPEISSNLLTHQLVPIISADSPDGRIGYWTMLAKVEQPAAKDGTVSERRAA